MRCRKPYSRTSFRGILGHIPRRAITGLPVKQAGISLSDPIRTTEANWTAPCMITGHLVAALRGTAEFRSGNHTLVMGEGRENILRIHAEEADTALEEVRAAASNPDARRMRWIQRTGAWLLVPP